MRLRGFVAAVTVLVVAASLATAVRAKDGKDGDKDKDNKAAAVMDAVVDFGAPHPQPTPAAASHFLQPVGGQPDGDTTIFRGGTVTFRVNGGGHGVSVYRVTRETTRENILETLCAQRAACDADFIAAARQITDSDGHVLVDIGANPPLQRVDDPEHIMTGTAAQIGLVPGRFHTGSTPTAAGEQIRVKFGKKGKYLVICMNRAHSINDWMFAFVNVVGSDGDDQQ